MVIHSLNSIDGNKKVTGVKRHVVVDKKRISYCSNGTNIRQQSYLSTDESSERTLFQCKSYIS